MQAQSKSPATSIWFALLSGTALAHIGVLLFCRQQIRISNIVQLFAALLVVAACLRRAHQSSDRYTRSAWAQLSAAFLIYTAAQAYYAYSLIWLATELPYPSPADRLWMAFAFPILLVLVKRRSGTRWEWVDWLDAAQACLFFSLLYVLVFAHTAALSVPLAYELQSGALILAWVIRYTSTELGPDRTFFRRLGYFLVVYGLLSSLGDRWEQHHLPGVAWVGLCWSTPLLFFVLLALLPEPRATRRSRSGRRPRLHLPTHLHGLSALGLSVMSTAAAASLALHQLVSGAVALTIAFLIFAVRTSLRESQLFIAHGKLEHAVMHDPLTGLANRTRLLAELDLLLADPAEASRTGLLFLDLDRFKLINDSLGHEFGDRFLTEVAASLRNTVRSTDLVARLAGDEFVVILNGTTQAGAQALAHDIVHRFRKPIHVGGRTLHVSVSVGFAMGDPAKSSEDLLRDADSAMYAAKKQGKNQARSFSGSAADNAENYLRLESELRASLDNGELAVFYQPIYSMLRQEPVGFEALARWIHPERGLVSPAAFIPIAEETGLIVDLGKQVLRQACQQVSLWNERYDRRLTASVNVSARQFADPDLLHDIRTILAETGFPPELLKLEITETVLLDGSHHVAELLNAARALGIEVSLDDFLTGYSSLHYLLQYPCNIVKLDRSFVHAMDQDSRRAELVRTAVQLARNLDMDVIAEGVETEEELARLTEMGCDLIQGFLFSKPIPAAEVPALLVKSLERHEQPFAEPGSAAGFFSSDRLSQPREGASAAN